jgi:erythromycin esterase-like protein
MSSLADALKRVGVAAASVPLAVCSSGEAPITGAPGGGLRAEPGITSVDAVVAAARPILGVPSDYDALAGDIGDARFVLLGEATHGTHEFYRERARISMRLIRERKFRAVVIEGDWPDTDRLNRYVRGLDGDRSADAALSDFRDFPKWMWRNAEFSEFAEALRAYNLSLQPADRVGIYGMDVYNLFGAIDAVVSYLAPLDRAAADRARSQYRCFARYRPDPARYGEATRRAARSCEHRAAAVLKEFRERPRPDDPGAAEALFSAVRSAAAVVGAEEYNRAAYAGSLSWNVRDRHMAANVSEIADHTAAMTGAPGKVVIWAHNSHVGDARATEMKLRGELNLGQLLRERFSDETVYLLGFTTYQGTVIAADRWGGPHRVYNLRPASPDSYAGMFHKAGLTNALILLPPTSAVARALDLPRSKREIGVIYARDSELQSHYLQTRLARQFDAVIHLDRTRALNPHR